MASTNALRAALERLMVGTATEQDQQALQRALLGGSLVLTEGEGNVAISGDAQGATIISGDGTHVHMTINIPTGELLLTRLFPLRSGLTPPLPTMMFIGREEALLEIKGYLGVTQMVPRAQSFTVIRGWPGVGKTTLVAILAHDPDIAQRFTDGVLWTALGQEPDLLSTMAKWGRALGTEEFLRTPTLTEATALLTNLLHNKRILLIVDDVWETAHAVPFQQACGITCALLITTRLPSVAHALACDGDTIYNLPVLTEENAIRLLRLLAPTVVQQHLDACRELVCDLGCLPLALHVAGRLLNTEASFGWGVTELITVLREGAKVIEAKAPTDLIDLENQTIPTVAALLQKSTDRLPESIRNYFACLGIFAPKPATFDLKAMRFMWRMEDPKPIVRELVMRGLLEPIGGSRFQMHALLATHARSLLTD